MKTEINILNIILHCNTSKELVKGISYTVLEIEAKPIVLKLSNREIQADREKKKKLIKIYIYVINTLLPHMPWCVLAYKTAIVLKSYL